MDSRTLLGTGCPECTLIPRSKTEIRTGHEIAHFVPFDLDSDRVKLPGGARRQVDFVLRDLGIAIEFDGAYHHAGREPQDREKVRQLEAAGWTVIRLRETPLDPLGPNDVVVPQNAPKATATAALRRIEALTGSTIPGLDRYARRKTLVAAREAEAHIERLLEAKAAWKRRSRKDGNPID